MGKGDRDSGGWGTLINDVLETHFPTLFHTASALSASSGHLPLEGKAIHAPRRFYIFMRRTTTPHSSLLTPN